MTAAGNSPEARPPAPTRFRWRSRRRLYLVAAGVLAVVAAAVVWRLSARPAAPDPTLARLVQARADLAAARFPEAREGLRAVRDKWPLDAEVHFLLAQACRRDDDLDGWEYHFRAASRLQWPTADLEREQLLARVQTGDVRLAAWVTADSEDAGVLLVEALAKGCLATYRLDDLLRCTQEWIDRRPGDWQPYYLRGLGYQYARLLARAADDFRAALERNPNHRAARLRLAQALMVEGLYRPAVSEYEAYLSSDPRHPDALVGLAHCQFNLTQPEAARVTLDRLFAAAPDHPAGCFLRAQLEADADPAAALEWLRRAERRAPRETDITSAFVRVLNQLGRHDEAACYQYQLDELRADLLELDEVRRAVRRTPDQTRPRLEAGELCIRLGRVDEAANWFRSVLAIDPSDPEALRALSVIGAR